MPRIAGHRLTRAESVLRCPCCRQQRTADEYRTFLRQLGPLEPLTTAGYHTAQTEGSHYWQLARQSSHYLRWACDLCLETGRATLAQLPRQYRGYGDPPHFAYYDQEKTCRDCGQPFIFSQGEQQHWYETLGFRLDVTRIRCQTCTQRKHVRAHLSRLLIERDYTDLGRTRQIIDLYVQFGQFEAAKRYLSLSRHAFSATSPEYQLLGAWRAEVKTQEQQAAANQPPAA